MPRSGGALGRVLPGVRDQVGVVGVDRVAELRQDHEDLVRALAGQLDVLALRELDDLVLALRRGRAGQHLLQRALLELVLLDRLRAAQVVVVVPVVVVAVVVVPVFVVVVVVLLSARRARWSGRRGAGGDHEPGGEQA